MLKQKTWYQIPNVSKSFCTGLPYAKDCVVYLMTSGSSRVSGGCRSRPEYAASYSNLHPDQLKRDMPIVGNKYFKKMKGLVFPQLESLGRYKKHHNCFLVKKFLFDEFATSSAGPSIFRQIYGQTLRCGQSVPARPKKRLRRR